MSPAESREPGMRWYGGLGADHGQKRELGGVTITRGDLTSPGPLQKAVYSLTRRSQQVMRLRCGYATTQSQSLWNIPTCCLTFTTQRMTLEEDRCVRLLARGGKHE